MVNDDSLNRAQWAKTIAAHTGAAAKTAFVAAGKNSSSLFFHIIMLVVGAGTIVLLAVTMGIYQFSIEIRQQDAQSQPISIAALFSAADKKSQIQEAIATETATLRAAESRRDATQAAYTRASRDFLYNEAQLRAEAQMFAQDLGPGAARQVSLKLDNEPADDIKMDRQVVLLLDALVDGKPVPAKSKYTIDKFRNGLYQLEGYDIQVRLSGEQKTDAQTDVNTHQALLDHFRDEAKINNILSSAYTDAGLPAKPSAAQLSEFNDFVNLEQSGFFKFMLAMPYTIQALIFTILMGILGSVAIFYCDVVNGRDEKKWIRLIYRPMLGAMLALGVYGLMKAGVVILSQSGTASSGDALNPYFVGFLGLVSGVSSENIIDRIKALMSSDAANKNATQQQEQDHEPADNDADNVADAAGKKAA